jgi:hypothetical protein
MALTGSFYHITHTQSDSNFHSESITYPLDLPVDDPNYNKRGTSENILIPDLEETITEYTSSYAVIHNFFNHSFPAVDEDQNFWLNRILEANVRVYPSKESRNLTIDDYLVEELVQCSLNVSQSAHDQMYEHLKTLRGYVSMSNA